MFDSYNRDITYLRISVTDRCNLRCLYCMPEEGVTLKRHDEILSYEKIATIVQAAAGLGINKVRLTGGEPLVRKGVVHLIRELKKIAGIQEVTLTTNGILLADMAEILLAEGLDRLNISLDTLDPEKYRQVTRGGDITAVLRGIDTARRVGFQRIKINMVLLTGFNEEEVPLMQRFCLANGLELQRIRRYRLNDSVNGFSAIAAERPSSCRLCNRIRLTADGRLKPCLFNNSEYPVDFADLSGCIERAIRAKPAHGILCSNRGNWQIGG